MEYTTILYIAIIVLGFLLALALIKSLVKALLAALIIALVFRVLWIYTPEQLVDTFHLEKIMSEEQLEKAMDGYEDFTRKRTDFILNPEMIDKTAKDALQDKVNEVLNSFDEADEN